MCLKESCFLDYLKVSSVVHVVRNVGEWFTAKSNGPVRLLSVIIKIFEKHVNSSLVDNLQKHDLILISRRYFSFSLSAADLLTVVPDRIASTFNRPRATRAVALDISKAFDRVWHAGFLYKLKSYGISGRVFGLIL